MFNLQKIIENLHAALAEATTVSSKVIKVATEVRTVADAAGQWSPTNEADLVGHIIRLTGSTLNPLPEKSTENELARGLAIATALVDHIGTMGASAAQIPVTVADGTKVFVTVGDPKPGVMLQANKPDAITHEAALSGGTPLPPADETLKEAPATTEERTEVKPRPLSVDNTDGMS